MSFSVKLIYLTIFSIFIKIRTQITLNCPSVLSPIDTASFSPNYLNIFMQFIPPTQNSTSSRITISSNLLTFYNADFGKLIINGNSDFKYKESKLIYTYFSTQMQISSPSLNKYWGNFTDFELILSFQLEKKTTNTVFPLLDNLMQNTIKLAIPIINIPGVNLSESTNMIKNISTFLGNQNNSIINTIYEFKDFDLEKQFTENNYLNNFKNFYFYVGNDAYDCRTNILWIIMNKFIILPDPYTSMLKTFFIKYNIDNTQILNTYYSRYSFPNKNVAIYKNFYINNVTNDLEKILLNSNSGSTKIKVLKKVLFMMIILLI